MANASDFSIVFEKLSAILRPYAAQMAVAADSPTSYYLNCPKQPGEKKVLSFAATIIGKSYVSFHLVPVYLFPELLEDMSPQLKKRMQGKGCFNFTTVDEEAFQELAQLTAKGFEAYREKGYVQALG